MHFTGLQSENIFGGYKSKVVYHEKLVLRSDVRFLILCILDHAQHHLVDFWKKRPANFNFIWIEWNSYNSRGWFIKNATGLVILLQKNIYSTFSTRFCYDWIIWDIKTSKDFVIHLGLPNWLILSIFKHFKQFMHKNFTKSIKNDCFWVLACKLWPRLGTE